MASCLICQLPPEKLNQVHAMSLSGVPWREVGEAAGVAHTTVMRHWERCAQDRLDLRGMRLWCEQNVVRPHRQLQQAATAALTELPPVPAPVPAQPLALVPTQASDLTPGLIAGRLLMLEAAGHEVFRALVAGGDTRSSILMLGELRKLTMSLASVAERMIEMEREQSEPVRLEPVGEYEYDRNPSSDVADREELALKIEKIIEQKARQLSDPRRSL